MNMSQIMSIRQKQKETMKISKVKIKDINNIVDLELRVFGHTLGHSFMVMDIDRDISLYLKIEENENLVGYISIRINDDKAEMLNFVVEPRFQYQGYGRTLLHCAYEKLQRMKVKSLILEVREYNKNARSFYEKEGFKELLIRKNYYNDCDAVVYIKEDI